jgi:hypothetical protein
MLLPLDDESLTDESHLYKLYLQVTARVRACIIKVRSGNHCPWDISIQGTSQLGYTKKGDEKSKKKRSGTHRSGTNSPGIKESLSYFFLRNGVHVRRISGVNRIN